VEGGAAAGATPRAEGPADLDLSNNRCSLKPMQLSFIVRCVFVGDDMATRKEGHLTCPTVRQHSLEVFH
jgi:hypothetical protein